MFTKLILSLLVLVAPLVSAFTVSVADGATSGGNITISWTTITGDPATWSFELLNPSLNFSEFALANNVDSSLGNMTYEAPITATPGSGYTVEAVDISNITNVYATSAPFTIGATLFTSTTGSTTASGTNALTSTANSLASVTSASAISSGAGTGTGTGTTDTGTGTSTGASTTPSSAATSSRLSLTNTGGYAVLLLSAVAGAVAIAF